MEQKLDSIAHAWQTSELNGDSSDYLEMLYEAYLQAPESVSSEWQQYFKQLPQGRPGSSDVSHEAVRQAFIQMAKSPVSAPVCVSGSDAHKLVAVMNLIYAY